MDPKLIPATLTANQYLIVQFDLDPSTGDPFTELIDVEVYVYDDHYVERDDGLPLQPFGDAGLTITWTSSAS